MSTRPLQDEADDHDSPTDEEDADYGADPFEIIALREAWFTPIPTTPRKRTMSRTHTLASGQLAFDSDAHVHADAIERAAREGLSVDNPPKPPALEFDLTEIVKAITTKRLKDDVLSRLLFSADAYLGGALNSMLNKFWKQNKTDPTAIKYDSYRQFLFHIEQMEIDEATNASHEEFTELLRTLEADEAALIEAGLEVTPAVARFHTLTRLRTELHDIAGNDHDLIQCRKNNVDAERGYVQPSIGTWLANPKMRSLSVAGEQGLIDICIDDEPDDKELQAAMLEQYKLDDHTERANEHRLQKMKAQSLVTLWQNLSSLSDDNAHFEDDELDPAFTELDARTQFALIGTALRAIVDSRRKAVTDNRLSVKEKAVLRVEAKALIVLLSATLEHPAFSDL